MRMAGLIMQMAMAVKRLTVVSLTMAVNTGMVATLAMALTRTAVNLQQSFLHLTPPPPVLRPTPSDSKQN